MRAESAEHLRERAEYFETLSLRAVEKAFQILAAERSGLRSKTRILHLGEDLASDDLRYVERFFAGELGGLSAFEEAQIRELAFWRWVALEGYAGRDPRLFPLLQEHTMVSTFYRTGWTRTEFRASNVIELGCGPLGMIEYIPAAQRFAFDPLNSKYGRLFSECRGKDVTYCDRRESLELLSQSYDLGICHNVIDHVEEPAWWFNMLFSKLRFGAKFLFQVNTSRVDHPQPLEHLKMHPSPILHGQILEWLNAKSDHFDHFIETSPSECGEFYFLAWGIKSHDGPIRYQKPVIGATAS